MRRNTAPHLAITVSYQISGRRGSRLVSEAAGEGHSPVIAWLDIFYAHIAQATMTLTDTNNFVRTVYVSGNSFSAKAPAATSSWGPQVGSGITPVTMLDSRLATLIPHGNNPGQLFYDNTETIAPVTSGPDRSFLISRFLTNNTASDVLIREIGLVTMATVVGETPKTFLVERTVLSSPVTVTPGNSKQLRYTVRISLV